MSRKAAIILTVLGLLSILNAQESGVAQVRDLEPFWYVCMDFTGSVGGEKVEQFIREARKQGLATKVRGDLFHIMTNFPGLGRESDDHWGLGFRIDEPLDLKPPLFIRRYEFSRVVIGCHQGPFETAFSTMNDLLSLIERKGLMIAGPPFEIWIGDPARDKPEDLRTEIIVPVREKGG